MPAVTLDVAKDPAFESHGMTKRTEDLFKLSKSSLTAFEQCPKRLWLSVHRGDLRLEEGAVFDVGSIVEDAARGLHPEGVMIDTAAGHSAAALQTRTLIAERHEGPLFEATFQYDGVTVRVDILERIGDEDTWALAEVKSSASIKDYHLGDLATQVWVLENRGISIQEAAIRRIDTGFHLEREGDYDGLLVDDCVLDKVRPLVATRALVVERAREVLAGDEPDCIVGEHCSKPFSCEFSAYCSKDLPAVPEWPISILPNGAWKKWSKQGIVDLLELDEATMAKPRERMIVAATRSGEPFHDVEGARKVMSEWSYPRAWLDFETISAAVPRWVGTRPYQQIPFQFSLHLEQEDGSITHHEFLCCDGTDPRAACAQALVDAIPSGASVIAYNAGFERSVLRGLAGYALAHADALLAMADNTVDLLPVARAHWYHRDQRGSWSIKAVLPTIADLNYASLEVKDGGMAQDSFLEAIDPATTPDRRWALEEALRAYCMRDTWAMVLVARKLAGES